MNKKAMKVLEKLAKAGFNDEKKIQGIRFSDVKKLRDVGGISPAEFDYIEELQEVIKKGTIISYLCGEEITEETTEEVTYGQTN